MQSADLIAIPPTAAAAAWTCLGINSKRIDTSLFGTYFLIGDGDGDSAAVVGSIQASLLSAKCARLWKCSR